MSRGYLPHDLVRKVAFWTVTACIIVAAFVAILAIWQFAGTEVMWRAFATCGVIGAGTLAFAWLNEAFGNSRPSSGA